MATWMSYSTSLGTRLSDRGRSDEPTLPYNYLSGTGKSHEFRGAGYYVPSEKRWIPYHQYKHMAREARRDAILFESEDEWVKFQRQEDAPKHAGGITLSGRPELKYGAPTSTMIPHHVHSWNKSWSGPGYYAMDESKWINEHRNEIPSLPRNSMQFINEEDWMKFKFIAEKPSIL